MKERKWKLFTTTHCAFLSVKFYMCGRNRLKWGFNDIACHVNLT